MEGLDTYLAKFDAMIDFDHYGRVREGYERVFSWEAMDELPYVWREMPPVADTDWPDFDYNDTFVDMEKMLLTQLRSPFLHYQAGDYYPLSIRANYGTVILPSIFGAEYQLTETSLPWAHHIAGGRDAIRRLIDAGIPDVRSGLGARCFDTADYYREMLAPYPTLAAATTIYHPDLQGPFDVAHLIWGPDIFLALFDCPDLVHDLLDLIVRGYIHWLTRWKEAQGEGNDFTSHWSIMMKGGAMVRDDTPIMLSRAQYEEFVKPYDQRILDAFGGAIHYCGRGDQFVASMAESENLYAINASQPDWNDMDLLWRVTRENRLVLLDIHEDYVPAGTNRGVTLQRTWRHGEAMVVEDANKSTEHQPIPAAVGRPGL